MLSDKDAKQIRGLLEQMSDDERTEYVESLIKRFPSTNTPPSFSVNDSFSVCVIVLQNLINPPGKRVRSQITPEQIVQSMITEMKNLPCFGFGGKKRKIMEIIVLEGPKHCGKTSTLGMLYALMLSTQGTTQLKYPVGIDGAGSKDFLVSLNYTGKVLGRKKISIFTAGDTRPLIEFGIAYATTIAKADILIAANSYSTYSPTRKPSSVLYAPHTIRRIFSKKQVSIPTGASVCATHLAENMKIAKDIEALL
jgi:hypothetical protein